MNNAYIGIDNGVSGTIGVYEEGGEVLFFKTPVFSEQDYCKKKQQATRIDTLALLQILIPVCRRCDNVYIYFERPMINSKFFKATVSAARSLEATLIVLEMLRRRFGNVSYSIIDSKEWQSAMLPRGVKGTTQLKQHSFMVATRLFPKHSELLLKHKDGDGLLIMEYLRRCHNRVR